MSIKAYPNNQQDCLLSFDTREKHFTLYYKFTSRFVSTPLEIRQAFGVARNTPGVKAMQAWAEEMLSSYVKTSLTDDDDDLLRQEIINNEGFGPEAHGDEEEPNDNTRMIV